MRFLDILPDLLRGNTAVIAMILLFPVLSRTKLKNRTYALIIALAVTLNTVLSTGFYLSRNYTAVVYYSFFFYVIMALVFKYLFKEKLFQWLFNAVTVLNIYTIVVFASYFLAFLFPHPSYAISAIRVVLFVFTYIFFKRLLRLLYLQVSENWAAFLLPISGILAGYLYLLLSLGDVEASLNANIAFFLILTLITVFSYIAIIFSLNDLRAKFLLREENFKKTANEALLKNEISAYESAVNAAKQTRHDIRHHNAILLEYLDTQDFKGAKDYLMFYDDNLKERSKKDFSKNSVANAVFRIYDKRSRELGVEFIVQSEADSLLNDRFPDIGVVLSNILENALTACKSVTFEHPYIHYRSTTQHDSILIQVKNSVEADLTFEQGLPLSAKPGGGTGLFSVKSMVEKHRGMLDVRKENHEFITQIILPI